MAHLTALRVGVLLVSLLVAACGSVSTRPSTPTAASTSQSAGAATAATTVSKAPSPAPLVVAGLPSDSLVESGTCNWTTPETCSRVSVAQWHDVAYTPVIPCGSDAGVTCRLMMDITAPTSGGPWPLIVFLPGGPSAPDERYRGALDPFATALSGQGAVVMVAGWREGPDWGGGYPISFQDVACAIGVARKIGPAYGASPDRVTLHGHSTGAWPAAVVGLTPTPFTPAPGSCNPTVGSLRPDVVVIGDGNVNEVTAPDEADGSGYVTTFLGGERTMRPGVWAAADPFALAKRYGGGATATPFLLVHGSDDTAVLPAVSKSFQATLVAAGYRSRLVEIPGAGHVDSLLAKDDIDAVLKVATGG